VFVRSVSEEGRGSSQSVNPNSSREIAKAMLLAAKGKTANYSSVGSGEYPVQRGSVNHALSSLSSSSLPSSSSSSSSSSSGRMVEQPVFEVRNLSNTSYRHSDDDDGVTFKRIVIVKTTTLNVMKGKNHE